MIPFKLPSLKTIGIIVIILLIIYAWGATQFAISQKKAKEVAQTERDQAVAIATQQKEETTHYRNAYNNEVARVKDTQMTLDNVNRLFETKELSWLKQIEGLKKKNKNLESATRVDMSFRGDSIIRRTIYVPCSDTLELFRYYIHDEFNYIDAVVLDTPVFELRAPVYIAALWQRKKFLWLRIGKKEYFTEATTPNKLIRIDTLTHFTIGRKRRK